MAENSKKAALSGRSNPARLTRYPGSLSWLRPHTKALTSRAGVGIPMGEHWLVSLTLSARTAPQLLSTETSAPLWRTPHREAQTRPLATPTLTAHPGPAIPLVSASGPPCHSRPSVLIGKGARHSQGGSAGARSRPFGTTCCPEWETRQASQRAPSLGCRFGPPAAAPPRSPAARASVTRPYTAAAAHRASARRAPGLAGPRQPLRTPSGSGSTASPPPRASSPT